MVIAMFFLLKSMLPFLEGGKSLSLDSMRLSKKHRMSHEGGRGLKSSKILVLIFLMALWAKENIS